VISGFTVVEKCNPDKLSFLNFFSEYWQVGSYCGQAVGPFQLRFSYWLKTLVTPLHYNIIFLNNFLLDYSKNAKINVDSETFPT